jgi:hypothetical protein
MLSFDEKRLHLTALATQTRRFCTNSLLATIVKTDCEIRFSAKAASRRTGAHLFVHRALRLARALYSS